MDWRYILDRVMNPFFKAQRATATKGPELPGAAGRSAERARTAENKQLERIVWDIECDYQFKFARECLQSLVTTNKVSFAAADGADAKTQAVATNLQHYWDATIVQAFQCFSFGRAAFEKSYRHDQGADAIVLDSLDYLPFADSEMKLGAGGEFEGVKIGKDVLPPESIWWLALDPTPKEPHGRSRYLGAPYRVREWRRALEDNERIWYNRFSIGQGVGRFPEPTGAEAALSQTHPRDAMAAMLEQIRSGGTLLLSSQQYMGTDGGPSGSYLYDYTPSEGLRDSTPLVTHRQELDVCVLRSLSIPEMALTNPGQTGTYSMAEAHQILLDATADGILSQIVTSFQKYVADKVAALNGVNVAATWTPLVEKRRQAGEKAAQQKAQQQAAGMPFGSFAIGQPRLPSRVATDSQVADKAIASIDHDGMSADLREFLSDRGAVQSAMQNVVGDDRRRL